MKVILICGKKGAGKDTFVNYINMNLSKDFPGTFTIVRNAPIQLSQLEGPAALPIGESWRTQKFATPLKRCVQDLLDIEGGDYEQIKDQKIPDPYIGTLRDYLVGVAFVVREIDPDFFAKKLYEELKCIESFYNDLRNECEECKDKEGVVAITDWRYPNEYDYLKAQGMDITTVRVVRENNPLPASNHPSETSLDDFQTDYTVLSE